jgi:hypothetical protein
VEEAAHFVEQVEGAVGSSAGIECGVRGHEAVVVVWVRGPWPGRGRQRRGLVGELLGEGSEAQEEVAVSEVSGGEAANEEVAGNGTSEVGHKVMGTAAAATSESLRAAAAGGCRLAGQSGARGVPCNGRVGV